MILLSWDGPVAIVTLNRPERHNSLVPSLLGELLAALAEVETRPGARALVLQANGRSFSTGGDVRAFYEHLDNLEEYAGEIVGMLNQAILKLFALPVPSVAAVHGIVTGGSLGLILACDVVLVAPQASFTPYYGTVGFSPDGGWAALLPVVIGPKRAAEVLLRDLTITAEQAVAWGLASRTVLAGEIHREALAVALDMASQKPGSLAHTRALLRAALDDLGSRSLEDRLEAERVRFIRHITSQEACQGMADFLDKPLSPSGPRKLTGQAR